jgi:hypothetical protein
VATRQINIAINGDASDATDAIRAARQQLEDLAAQRRRQITVDIDVNASNVDAQIDRARRRIDALAGDLDDAADNAGRSFFGGLNDGILQVIGRAIPQAQGMLANLGSAGGPIGLVVAAGLVASLVAAVTLAAPLVASALIGGMGLALAGVTLAVGIKFAIDAPEVQAQIEALGATFKSTMETATYPLRGPLVEALGTFRDMVKEIGPQLRQVFEALAPVIEPFATALADLVVNAMPGFVSLVQTFAPLIAQLAPLLPPIGTALSQMMTEFSKSPEAQKMVIGLIAAVLQFLPGLITWLGSTTVSVAAFGTTVAEKSEQAIAAFNSIKTAAGIAFGLLRSGVAATGQAISSGMAMADQAVSRARTGITSSLSSVVSSAVSTAARFVSSLVGGFNSATSAATSFGSRILSIITGLGGRFFAAGAQIIAQLTSGITSRISGAINAVSGLASKLAGYLPGSPVKEGELRSLNRGHAGGEIVEMLTFGIQRKGPMAQDALTAALPSPVAAAAGGARRAGGGVVLQIDLSGAVVDRGRFIAELRQEIARVAGGNVQVALGS